VVRVPQPQSPSFWLLSSYGQSPEDWLFYIYGQYPSVCLCQSFSYLLPSIIVGVPLSGSSPFMVQVSEYTIESLLYSDFFSLVTLHYSRDTSVLIVLIPDLSSPSYIFLFCTIILQFDHSRLFTNYYRTPVYLLFSINGQSPSNLLLSIYNQCPSSLLITHYYQSPWVLFFFSESLRLIILRLKLQLFIISIPWSDYSPFLHVNYYPWF
jgi:hypothetical protein